MGKKIFIKRKRWSTSLVLYKHDKNTFSAAVRNFFGNKVGEELTTIVNIVTVNNGDITAPTVISDPQIIGWVGNICCVLLSGMAPQTKIELDVRYLKITNTCFENNEGRILKQPVWKIQKWP